MEQVDKNRFDAIFQLYSHAWQQFNTRRTYEWQICIALWTALAFAIAGVVNATTLPKLQGGIYIPGIILLTAIALQCYFIVGIANAHKSDREMAIHYGEILQYLSGSSFDEALENSLKKGRGNWGKKVNWSSVFQVGITCLLSLLFMIVMHGKMNDNANIENGAKIKRNLEASSLK